MYFLPHFFSSGLHPWKAWNCIPVIESVDWIMILLLSVNYTTISFSFCFLTWLKNILGSISLFITCSAIINSSLLSLSRSSLGFETFNHRNNGTSVCNHFRTVSRSAAPRPYVLLSPRAFCAKLMSSLSCKIGSL